MGMLLRNLLLTVTGLAVGVSALLLAFHFKAKRPLLALAWLGVAGSTYIIGRYVVYPQASIPYTALYAWFTGFITAIGVGGIGHLLRSHDRGEWGHK